MVNMLQQRTIRIACYAAAFCTFMMPQRVSAAHISATVDQTEVSLQDDITLTVTIEGSRHAQPILPPMPDFTVHEGSQSTHIQSINGRMSTQISFTYTLLPKRIGTFVIGSVQTEVNHQHLHSEPFQITVTQAPSEAARNDDIFITTDLSETKAFINQQLTYTWRLFRRVRIGDARMSLPSFDNFIVHDLAGQHDYKTQINGQQYVVTEIKKALFPQELGAQKLASSHIQVEVATSSDTHNRMRTPFGDLLGTRAYHTRRLVSPEISLDVVPLPPAPPDYFDLVGQYQIDSSLSATNVQIGDSVTLTVGISGAGAIESIPDPGLPEISGLKTYNDRPTTTVRVEGSQIVGQKIFKKALVPTQIGDLEVPAISMTYFDPKTQSYQTTMSPKHTLHVTTNARLTDAQPQHVTTTPKAVQKTDIAVLHDDILPLYRRPDALVPPNNSRHTGWIFATIWLTTPLLALLDRLGRRLRNARKDTKRQRKRLALRRALTQCDAMEQALSQQKFSDAAALGSRAIRSFLGDRLDLEGMALTVHEVRDILSMRGLPASVCLNIEGWLQKCDAAQYGSLDLGADGAHTVAQLRDMLKELNRLLST